MNWMNHILILLGAMVAVFLEASFDGFRHWFGAQIDLLPALIVYAALRRSLTVLTTLAVAGGLWFDALSANPLGISVLPLLVVGLLIHGRRELILKEQLFAQCVLGLAASALTPVGTVLLLLTTGHPPLLGWGSLWQWVVMSLGGALFTPLVFRLFDALARGLSYRPVSETSFRADREIRRGRS
jgi:rod shape-determining protein MreD